MLRALDRYLLGEIIVPLVAGILGFVVIILGDELYRYIGIILDRRVPLIEVLSYLVFHLPAVVVMTLPVSVALGCSVALSRLNKDNELPPIYMAGVSKARLLLPFLLFGLLMAGVTFAVGEKIVPWAATVSRTALASMLSKQPTLLPKGGTFVRGRGPQASDWYFRIQSEDRKTNALHQILIYQIRPSGLPIIYTAETATLKNNFWALQGARAFQITRGGEMIQVDSETMSLDLREMIRAVTGRPSPEEMRLGELKKEIQRRRQAKIPSLSLETDLQEKFAIPAACFFFVVIACPLSIHFRAPSELQGVLFTVGLVGVYYLLLLATKTVGLQFAIPAAISAWMANGLFLVAGTYLLWRKW